VRRSLYTLGLTLIMAWLVLDPGLDPQSALWIAWAISVLLVLGGFLILMELVDEPEDLGRIYRLCLGRIETSIAQAWRRIRNSK
jgi:hypothetical protein